MKEFLITFFAFNSMVIVAIRDFVASTASKNVFFTERQVVKCVKGQIRKFGTELLDSESALNTFKAILNLLYSM